MQLLQDLHCAGGAGVDALLAVGTLVDHVGIAELGLDLGTEATAYQTQNALLSHFLTHTDAQAAQDALACVALDGDQLGLGGGHALAAFETAGVDLVAPP